MLSVGGDPYLLISDLSSEKIQYAKVYFNLFIPDLLSFAGYQESSGSFNCLKIVMIADNIFGLLFENCSSIPIINIDFNAKSAVLVKMLNFDGWVVDFASFQSESGSCCSVVFLVSGKQYVYVSSFNCKSFDLSEPVCFDIQDDLLDLKSISDCSLVLRQLFSWNIFRRGYNWSEKQEKQSRYKKDPQQS